MTVCTQIPLRIRYAIDIVHFGCFHVVMRIDWQAKLAEVKGLIEPIFRRAEEAAERPKLLEDVKKAIKGTRDAIEKWPITHPQVCNLCGFCLACCCLVGPRDRLLRCYPHHGRLC